MLRVNPTFHNKNHVYPHDSMYSGEAHSKRRIRAWTYVSILDGLTHDGPVRFANMHEVLHTLCSFIYCGCLLPQ